MSRQHSRSDSIKVLLVGAVAVSFVLLFFVGLAKASWAVRGARQPSQAQVAALAATTQAGTSPPPLTPEEQQCTDHVGGQSFYSSLPPDKRVAYQPVLDRCVEARRNPPPHPLLGPAPVPASPTPLADRILPPDAAGQQPYGNARLISGWAGDRLGVNLVVYTGSFKSDPSQGILYLRMQPRDGHIGSGAGPFLTPVKAGAIHVVQVSGNLVELQAEDGTTFYFDVSSRQFVSLLP
ncbi:MAG: hypothetical protein ACR2PL_10830 [Dehalococcoidia bacterium]